MYGVSLKWAAFRSMRPLHSLVKNDLRFYMRTGSPHSITVNVNGY